MINIKEKNLRDLLNRRKQFIKTHVGFIEAFVGFILFVISLLTSNILEQSLKTQIAVGILAVFYIVLTVYSFKDSHYSVEKFYNDILATSESKKHDFSLIVIKDKHNKYGKYLLQYNSRWNCYMFPFLRTKSEGDIDSIKDFLEYELGLKSFEIGQTKESDFTKVSVSANLVKTFHHTFYPVDIGKDSILSFKDKVKINKNKFKWFSIEEMKADKNIQEKNLDNVKYVEEYF